jgi:hypothetical protein
MSAKSLPTGTPPRCLVTGSSGAAAVFARCRSLPTSAPPTPTEPDMFETVVDGERLVLGMPLLLVDDRDGRVVAELESHEQGLRLLEALARDDPDTPGYLCIVSFSDRQGAVMGVDSSVTIRPLQD